MNEISEQRSSDLSIAAVKAYVSRYDELSTQTGTRFAGEKTRIGKFSGHPVTDEEARQVQFWRVPLTSSWRL